MNCNQFGLVPPPLPLTYHCHQRPTRPIPQCMLLSNIATNNFDVKLLLMLLYLENLVKVPRLQSLCPPSLLSSMDVEPLSQQLSPTTAEAEEFLCSQPENPFPSAPPLTAPAPSPQPEQSSVVEYGDDSVTV